MTEQEIRELIADALTYASVPGFRGSAQEAAFLAGASDVPLSEFEIDSLASMEVCIAIETNLGVTLLPGELPEIGSLGGLVRRVREAAVAGSV